MDTLLFNWFQIFFELSNQGEGFLPMHRFQNLGKESAGNARCITFQESLDLEPTK